MVPFGGWEMPLEYATGTIGEHLACHGGAVVFDVSHLGTVRLRGEDAPGTLQAALSNDLGKIGPGRAQYTHLLDDADASVLDDIIVWWHPEGDVFDVMPTRSTPNGCGPPSGGPTRQPSGPCSPSRDRRPRPGSPMCSRGGRGCGRFRVAEASWQGTHCTVAGTGYTGEPGVEIAVPAAAATALWEAVVGAGIVPAGLGARDTLRLEAGLPLHGHELGPGITSLQAGLGWVVAWDKPAFLGRAAAMAERTIAGCPAAWPGSPPRAGHARADCPVHVEGAVVGQVTSGNFSPVLEHGIALAFLCPGTEPGTPVEIDVRGTAVPGAVVPTPFVGR